MGIFYRNEVMPVLLVALPGFERAMKTRSREMESPGLKVLIIVHSAPTKNNCFFEKRSRIYDESKGRLYCMTQTAPVLVGIWMICC